MPSLRKRVSSYLRQLSFHNEPRDKRNNVNENAFVTKYLQGLINLKESPPIIYGKNPTDLPSYDLGRYDSGSSSIIGCYTGPNGGLTTVKRTEKHLCIPDDDIDFIDTHEDEPDESHAESDPFRKVEDAVLPEEWNRKSDFCYGLSDSLYDRNQITRQKNGDPIADCFGVIARKDSAILAVADGVNWGEKAAVAAKSAVHGSLHYLNKTIFNDTKPFEKLTTKADEANAEGGLNPDESLNLVGNTREVFVALLRAFNCAHDLILENKGMLTTLTVAVVLPLKSKSIRIDNGARTNHEPRYVCCVCNVGDTLAYVFSQNYGIRELTKGSHDVNSNRDMRDALGALGPVDGINPELSNLTLSITTLNEDDIVMVASDGLTDNFDPNVCKFTVNSTVDPPKAKRAGTVAAGLQQQQPSEKLTTHREETVGTVPKPPVKPPRKSKNRGSITSESKSSSSLESSPAPRSNSPSLRESSSNVPGSEHHRNPLVDHFMRQNSLDDGSKLKKPQTLDVRKQPPVMENKASSLRRQVSSQKNPPTSREGGYKLLKSKTSLDFRASSHKPQILRNKDGVPYVTPLQRYELQLLLMEDVLLNGISGRDSPTANAKRLCENLISFTISITAAKRRTLEDPDMYFDNRNGVLMEVSSQEKKLRRKRGLDKVQALPGKLDHVTIAAYNVGGVAR
ncbi:PP2C-like domain-containing protein CG9801 isoform X2 [Cylas formicarius]|uniref:PP2C-like domain-containing protein CG9801 isoform X2 n=1 Tax=Cylas formicarius TaxID=197179 RepID=UPI00295882FF|nr:PP2C-like domain-containing protein CG9801 isoform X2 [Cylas formicarius]